MEYDDDGLVGFGPKGAPAPWLREGEPGSSGAYRIRG
jgi:hypothetical protein